MKLAQIILVTLCALNVNAQKKSAIKLTEKAIFQRDHSTAIELYEQALSKDNSYTAAYLSLARLYALQHNFDKQIETLLAGSQYGAGNTSKINAQLSKAAFLSGKYDIAQSALQQLEPITNQDLLFLKECIEFSTESIKNKSDITAQNLDTCVNTKFHDYWPYLSIDENNIITTVFIEDEKGITPSHEDFYISCKKDGKWQKSEPLNTTINTPNNEGAQCLSLDGKIMLFTACDRENGFGSCDIYISRKTNNTWSQPQALPFPINTDAWDGHPSLSTDGKHLYFSSNRNGGYGGYDIYQVTISFEKSNSIINIINLGKEVNTDKDEISPFIHPDNNTLYFSSNGHIGMGRHDIFLSKKNEKMQFSRPTNLGYPINTFNDEIGFIVNTKGNTAYFSSERNDSRKRDIYTIDIPERYRPTETNYFKANITDATTGLPLKANIELFNTKESKLIYQASATENITLALPLGENYALNVSKNGYLFSSEHFPLESNVNYITEKTVKLSQIKRGHTLVLHNILFAHDSSNLDTTYTAELEKTITLIKQNPDLKFEISGHTDSSGSDLYNLKLSNERAKVIYLYFITKGIKESQISYKGYGSKYPISNIPATNRRTELLIK